MEKRIKEHIEELFADIPLTEETEEIKKQTMRKALDCYHDAVVEGKKPETACKKAIDQIGDVKLLVEHQNSISQRRADSVFTKADIRKSKHKQGLLMGAAVFLYIICVYNTFVRVHKHGLPQHNRFYKTAAAAQSSGFHR